MSCRSGDLRIGSLDLVRWVSWNQLLLGLFGRFFDRLTKITPGAFLNGIIHLSPVIGLFNPSIGSPRGLITLPNNPLPAPIEAIFLNFIPLFHKMGRPGEQPPLSSSRFIAASSRNQTSQAHLTPHCSAVNPCYSITYL